MPRAKSREMIGNWRSDALCDDKRATRQAVVDVPGVDERHLFSPEDLQSTKQRRLTTMAAKRVCDLCIVRAECLDEALRNEETTDIWGGMTPAERQALRSRRQPNRREA